MAILIIVVFLFNNRMLNLWSIYALTFILSSISQFYSLTKSSYLNSVYSEERLKVNSIFSGVEELASIVGPILASLLTVFISLKNVLIIDALTFVFSGVMISFFIKKSENLKEDSSLRDGFKESILMVKNIKVLKIILYQFVVIMVCTSPNISVASCYS